MLSSADFFQNSIFKIFFLENIFEEKKKERKKQRKLEKNNIRVANGLNPDQDRRFVRPDLDPNCL